VISGKTDGIHCLNRKEVIMEKFNDDEELDEDTQKDKFLTFLVDDEDYGIEIGSVIEIVSVTKITKVPDVPDHIKGVINLRGNVIPVIDVRKRFNIAEKAYDERTCIIVIDVEKSQFGLIVDLVNEVVVIKEDMMSNPPQTGKNTNCISSLGKVGDSVKIILDVKKIIE